MSFKMSDDVAADCCSFNVEMDEDKLMQLFKTLDVIQRNMDAIAQ